MVNHALLVDFCISEIPVFECGERFLLFFEIHFACRNFSPSHIHFTLIGNLLETKKRTLMLIFSLFCGHNGMPS